MLYFDLFTRSCLVARFWVTPTSYLRLPLDVLFNELIFEFLWPTVDITDILESCLHFDFPSRLVYCKFSDVLSPAIISLISLAEIWKAHFQCVFNSTAFNPIHVLHSIRRQIAIYIAEQALTDE
ncbi:MAG: hypothetical protein EXX96DRAFT_541941 [Benjaminiella poitrasii]|nr:MAG: hypothetical protein EXX96DRAFT_541941 [Benjaminiella poitrasii]